jgi:O-acetyl-ADP-ribose deacetylase (regulator of RNase III)
MDRIELYQGDITKLNVDAIVNAANTSLLGGGGVDGAIHMTAGPQLLEECRTLGGCSTGQAKITKGYSLPAKWVIHTVGPVWRGGLRQEDFLLASAYCRSLELAKKYEMKTLAFPNISTGIYGFPKERAAHIAVDEVRSFLASNTFPEKVIFCVFDPENFEIYQRLLTENQIILD